MTKRSGDLSTALRSGRDDETTKSFALFASWLVLFQLLIPLAFVGQDLTLLCNETGLQQVSFDTDGNPVEVPNLTDHCDLCVLSTASDTAIQTPSVESTLSFVHLHRSTRIYASQFITHHPPGFSSRAPPVVS